MRTERNHHYFSFTKRERTGILALVLLIVILFVLPVFIHPEPVLPDQEAINQFRKELSKLQVQQEDDSMLSARPHTDESHGLPKDVAKNNKEEIKLSSFDPNLLSDAGWKNFGLTDRTIHTIRHYLEGGGRFRNATDLQKIYGLKKEESDRLLPYVKITREPGSNLRSSPGESPPRNARTVLSRNARPPDKKTTSSVLDINKADSLDWISLRGIGPVLASRILRFRDRLGGFYDIAQVGQTYGLPDSTFHLIKPFLSIGTGSVRQMDVNTAGIDELKAHPYIGWNLAKAIVQYRQQHGAFVKLEDMLRISLLKESEFKKILPYVKTGALYSAN